jgi:hypothetical protein
MYRRILIIGKIWDSAQKKKIIWTGLSDMFSELKQNEQMDWWAEWNGPKAAHLSAAKSAAGQRGKTVCDVLFSSQFGLGYVWVWIRSVTVYIILSLFT